MKPRSAPQKNPEVPAGEIQDIIRKVVHRTPIYDIHTHLYDPAFGPLLLWGIDELITYHYLIAESFRHHRMGYDAFWALEKTQQADLIWEKLFVENSPISESCRGVVTCLNLLGLDVARKDLPSLRKHFQSWKSETYIDHVLKIANVEKVIMTNNPFDDLERPLWQKGFNRDSRFQAVLRLDDILMNWDQNVPRLREWGFEVTQVVGQRSVDEGRRFVHEWIERMNPAYLAVSLPPWFVFPDPSHPVDAVRSRLIADVVLPECREHGLPFAMMIGVKKLTNPHLRLAGDSLGRSDVAVVERMCATWPDNKFLVTMLSRENQHELCVSARKFHNLHVFGCWWFLNNPSIIEEMTRERIEILGLSVTPQHSDARVLDQLLYKWAHFREILTGVLQEKYGALDRAGWHATEAEIDRDVKNLLGGAFTKFLKN